MPEEQKQPEQRVTRTLTSALPKPEQKPAAPPKNATPDFFGKLITEFFERVISQYTEAKIKDIVPPALVRLYDKIIEYVTKNVGEAKAYSDAELKKITGGLRDNFTNYIEHLQAEDKDLKSLIEQAKGESQVLVSDAEKGLRKLLDAALKEVGKAVKSLRDKDSDLEGKVSELAAASKEHGETLKGYKTDIEESKKSATDQVSGARKALELQISGVKTALENKVDTDGKKRDNETVAVRRDLISYEGRLGRNEATLRTLEENNASKEEVGGLKAALETLRTNYDSFKRTVEARIEKISQESIARVEEVISAARSQMPTGVVGEGVQVQQALDARIAEIKVGLREEVRDILKEEVTKSIVPPEQSSALKAETKPSLVTKVSSRTSSFQAKKADDKSKKGPSILGDMLMGDDK